MICLASVTISTEPGDLQVPSNSEGCVVFTAVMMEILLQAICVDAKKNVNLEQSFVLFLMHT